jgi:hypothetical protein
VKQLFEEYKDVFS